MALFGRASTTFAGCASPATPALSIAGGDNSAALSWTASGTAVYDVFRNETGCNAGFTKIASGAAATALTDVAVANNQTYYYQVTAFPAGNESCASAPSTCVAVTPVSGPCIPPSAPASLSATAGSGGVALSWAAASGATEYHILRGTATGGPYTQIAVATGTTYTDAAVTGGTTYYYVVRAATGAGCESGNSPEASATPTTVADFSMSINPATASVGILGGTVTYTVTITRTGGFTGAVALTISTLPSTIVPTFSVNPVTGTSSTLSVKVKIGAAKGTYPFTVTGTSGTLTHTASAQVVKTN